MDSRLIPLFTPPPHPKSQPSLLLQADLQNRSPTTTTPFCKLLLSYTFVQSGAAGVTPIMRSSRWKSEVGWAPAFAVRQGKQESRIQAVSLRSIYDAVRRAYGWLKCLKDGFFHAMEEAKPDLKDSRRLAGGQSAFVILSTIRKGNRFLKVDDLICLANGEVTIPLMTDTSPTHPGP